MSNKKIGITMGDPFGIGPEILYRSWLEIRQEIKSGLIIFGVPAVYPLRLKTEPDPEFLSLFYHSEMDNDSELEQSLLSDKGECLAGGRAAFAFLQQSVSAVNSAQVHGLINGPVSKKAVSLSQPGFLGHTQFYEQWLCRDRAVMSFYGSGFSLSLLTHHIPLRDCSDFFMNEDIEKLMRISMQGFGRLLHKKLRVAVCGFNAHAGEGGLLSAGEDEKISTLVHKLSAEGFEIVGPVPSDTLFVPDILSSYDLVFACNHDQGLIAFKSRHFHDGISITWGLEVPRMTVDHGTAYNLAGLWQANHESFKNALLCMDRLLQE